MQTRQLCSTVRSSGSGDGELELSLREIDLPAPGPEEVLIRVEAAPINPSDLGLLFGPADMSSAEASGEGAGRSIRAPIPEKLLPTVAARLGQTLPAGNEGAGVVVEAGADAADLQGRTVALLGGEMYADYRIAKAKQCLLLPEGTTPEQGASCFVNPLTALGMVETMKLEGHSALVHTAAASNLGQMLVKICQADGVPLVNIVRRDEQVTLLKELGAEYVCNSSDPDFMAQLTDALAATKATLGFDATGGGELAGQILGAMEAAASRDAGAFSRYGSTVHKQVYIYGGLDRSPTTLKRNFGMAWGLGGWLLPPFLARIGQDAAQALRERVAREITTTFASHYTDRISLTETLDPSIHAAYGRMATGAKYLVCPHSG